MQEASDAHSKTADSDTVKTGSLLITKYLKHDFIKIVSVFSGLPRFLIKSIDNQSL